MKIGKLLKILRSHQSVELYISGGADDHAIFAGAACTVPYMYTDQRVSKIIPSGDDLIIEFEEDS